MTNSDIAILLRKTAEYAINPAFKQQLYKRLLVQFREQREIVHAGRVLEVMKETKQ